MLDHPVSAARRRALEEAHGPRLVRAMLNGARDDVGPESDRNVAVVLDPVGDRDDGVRRCADIGTALMAGRGEVAQAMPVVAGDLARRTPLMHEIRMDGAVL